MTKSIMIIVFAALIGGSPAIADSPFGFTSPGPADAAASADAPDLSGRLEGTVLSADGHVVWTATNRGAVHVTGVSEVDGAKFDEAADPAMGGLYTIRNIAPGIYDVSVATGYINSVPYAPQRIMGVEIKSGVRTVLNITMELGENLQDKAIPTELTSKHKAGTLPVTVLTAVPATSLATSPTAPATTANAMASAQASEQIAGLQAEIDALRKQIAALQPPAAQPIMHTSTRKATTLH